MASKKATATRILRRFTQDADALVPLLLGVTVTVLGLLGIVKQDVVDNAILASLTVLAFALLRDRWAKETSDEVTRRVLASVEGLTTVKTLQGPSALEPAFAMAREHTTRWMFKGGTGTYTRAKTLPECVSKARTSTPRRGLQIRLEILDPTNRTLCERYARYRSSFASKTDGTGEAWTTGRTQKEAFATVLAARWHKQSYDLLDIRVSVTSIMSTFRYDLSDSRIIITQDDPRFPAVVISNESALYHGYVTELETSFQQAKPVDISKPEAGLSNRPTDEEVRQFFSAVGLHGIAKVV